MEYPIRIGDNIITLEHEDFEDNINVDELTTIDTSNLFGESVTVSASVNRIGMLKSACDGNMASAKLELKIYEKTYTSRLRKEASLNAGFYTDIVDGEKIKVKLTEKALETCYMSDPRWIELSKTFIQEERNAGNIASLEWSVRDKARKLNTIIGGTTPREFVDGLIEGKVNGILVKKNSKLSTPPSLGS